MTQPTVLILGATGRLGSACTRSFAAAGWQVFAQRRGAPPAAGPAGAPPAVQWLVTGQQPLPQAIGRLDRVDAVVHAMNPAYTDAAWAREAPGLLEDAVALARRHGALLMFPGNVYNFGAGMPPVLDEATPFAPTTAKGRIRVALEARLRGACEDGGLRAVVLRAGDFFGSGTGSWFDKLIAAKLPAGRLGYGGPLEVPTAWAYLPDFATAFTRVADRRDALAGCRALHFAGHTLSGNDWRAALTPIAQAQGWVRPGQGLKVSTLPWPLVRAVGLVKPEWASLAQMRYIQRTPHRLDGSALAAFIGAEPHTPLGVAVHQALSDLGMLRAAPGAVMN